MHRKSAPVPPPLHYPNRLAAQQPAPLKQPQHPLPHCRLHPLHTSFIHLSPAKRQPLPPCATTPSSMHKCKCACAFSVAPKRCTNNTPPLRTAAAVPVLAPAGPPAPGQPGARYQPRDQLHRALLEARVLSCAPSSACLRQALKSRRPRTRGAARRGTIPNIVSIHIRPPEIEHRGMPGQWEENPIKGTCDASAIARRPSTVW